MKTIRIGRRAVGLGEPAYTIAEIGSNFDGDIQRAFKLIDLAKECGADAAKFQCFVAEKIVSKERFEGSRKGFQAKWTEPVYEVYQHAELPRDWIQQLHEHSKKVGIDFLATPYDRAAADLLDKMGILAFKVGSGDITWLEFLEYVARKGKPVLLPTGASTLAEVDKAVKTMGLEATLTRVERIDEILTYGVMATPALVIDGQVKAAGRLPTAAELTSWLTTAAAR